MVVWRRKDRCAICGGYVYYDAVTRCMTCRCASVFIIISYKVLEKFYVEQKDVVIGASA